MIEEILSKLTLAMSGSLSLMIIAAFAWGMLSMLLSPCHLTSIPLIIGYITIQKNLTLKKSINLSLNFAVGVLLAIFTIGMGTAFLGRIMGDLGGWTDYLVAVVFILMGLYLIDIIPLNWSRFPISNPTKKGLLGAFIIGILMGIGLGPCTFAFMAPVLALVFQTATNNWFNSVLLITAFGLGHCSIIVSAGSLTSLVQRYLNWAGHSNIIRYLRKVAGVFVLAGGFYFIYTNI